MDTQMTTQEVGIPELAEKFLDLVSPELALRIIGLLENKIIVREKLSDIIRGLENGKNGKKFKKAQRALKKEVAVNGADSEEALVHFLGENLISYPESLSVWGNDLVKSEKSMGLASSGIISSKLKNFNFQTVALQGLSTFLMSQKFPDHNWGAFKKNAREAVAGYYTVSLINPLDYKFKNKAEELIPGNKFFRLDFNLTVELLLSLIVLNKTIGGIFFQTSESYSHGREVCVGIENGKLVFISETEARKKDLAIRACLFYQETWAD